MSLKLIHIFGRLLAICPEAISRALAVVLGGIIFALPTKRRRTVLANLHHAFPEMAEAERRRIARTSCCRAVEMALFVLVSPHFSKDQLLERFAIEPAFEQELNENARSPEPAVAIVPHLCLMESLTLLPALTNGPCPEIATIYRPLKQRSLEDWVLATRQRFGMRLLSRKEGFAEAIHRLRQREVVAILFDQNAGNTGVLSTFLGRVCSSTELPGMLASKFDARFVTVWTERTGFWRGVLRMEELPKPQSANHGIFLSNQWFEQKLRTEESFRNEWLWLHDRWRTQDQVERRFQLKHRRYALDEELDWREWEELPRGMRIWIRLPNWLGDVIMALPLVRALRVGRPDAEITLVARKQFRPLLDSLPFADQTRYYDSKDIGHLRARGNEWRLGYPDVQILFTNSAREDLAAKAIGAPQRFGILRSGKPRPLLTHDWPVPEGLDEASIHQTELWRQFLGHFGLTVAPDFSPLSLEDITGRDGERFKAAGRVGLICGTENEPAKRWPVSHWRALIDRMPDKTFVLFGTPNDRAITEQVADGFDSSRVVNRAGETNLAEFAEELTSCAALATNDTGGMHLANALGVPVVVVFGPTNPVRTGPCYSGPKRLIQPPECPATGGGMISDVTPERVSEALEEVMRGDSYD